MKLVLLATLTLAVLTPFTLAQEAAPIPMDPTQWFAGPAVLAAVLVAMVAFIRKHIWTTLDGVMVIIASVILGSVIGLVGQLAGWLTLAPYAAWPNPLGGLAFGAVAGLLASGAVDAVKGFLGGRR